MNIPATSLIHNVSNGGGVFLHGKAKLRGKAVNLERT